MKFVRKLFWIALFVGVLVFGWRFAADHSSQVSIKLPVIEATQLTLWLALLIAAAIGAGLTILIATFQIARLRLLARRYRKMIKGLESEVHQLRNLPLADAGSPVAQLDVATEADPVSRRALGRGA